MEKKIAATLILFFAAFFLAACASNHNYRPLAESEGVSVPPFIELSDAPSISTFHYPAGLYSLDAQDDNGFFYRAPSPVMKHSFAGFTKYEGGLFVRKKNYAKLRGYIVWAGGRTQIGNLARANYRFRNN